MPPQYVSLISLADKFDGEYVTLIIFPTNKSSITSSNVLKAQRKVGNTDIPVLCFANGFTMEAIQVLNENGWVVFSKGYGLLWTDEGYNSMRNSIYR